MLGVAEDFTLGRPPAAVIEVKLMLTGVFLLHAFLKVVWCNRLFGYCAVLMAAWRIWSRDFASHSRRVLIRPPAE